MAPDFLTDVPPFLDDRFPLPLDRPFTTAQARTAGVSAYVLRKLGDHGYLRRLVKGVLVAAQVPDSKLLRARALALTTPPGCVVTDWTATWYWTGLDHPAAAVGESPISVHRFRGHDRLRNKLVDGGQRWFRPSDVVPLTGNLSVTTPLRTVWDLGRLSPRIIAIGGMDGLVRHCGLDKAQVLADVERFRRQRGVVQLRHLAPLVDGRAESPGESALRLRWREAGGLPEPEPQIRILAPGGAELFRLDLGVEELRYAAEYDGEQHHSSDEDREADATRRAFLEEAMHWRIDVFRKEDVYGQQENATSRLLQGVASARRRGRRS